MTSIPRLLMAGILTIFAIHDFTFAETSKDEMKKKKSGAAASACMNDETFPDLSKAELQALVDSQGAFIIDVNAKDSYEKTKIPGAIHFGSNKKKLGTLLPENKDSLIVAYCGGPSCTAWKEAARAACKLGYKNVKHFKGGITGWNQSDS